MNPDGVAAFAPAPGRCGQLAKREIPQPLAACVENSVLCGGRTRKAVAAWYVTSDRGTETR
ncbi:MAG TPA: hypothetical protein VL242_41510, partial [Sorangium sp.]|nr:hypothetical protein [Sorangium sp.]